MDYYLNKLNLHNTSIIPHRLKLFGQFDFKRISLFFSIYFFETIDANCGSFIPLWIIICNKFESVALGQKNSDGRPESNLPNYEYGFMQVAFFSQNGF